MSGVDGRILAIDELTRADWWAAMAARHAVRRYLGRPIEAPVREALDAAITRVNAESGLSIQVAYDEPLAFSTGLARTGSFAGVANYLALVGPAGKDLDETVGYAGERVVLYAQHLGINTCWVAMTFNRSKTRCVVRPGEKLALAVALGYGESQGEPHKSKPLARLATVVGGGPLPDWFRAGVQAVQLAPSGMNTQPYIVELDGQTVRLRPRLGTTVDVNLGIARCHFELGVEPGAPWAWA